MRIMLTLTDRFAYWMFMLHFVKRELETLLYVSVLAHHDAKLTFVQASIVSLTARCRLCTSSESAYTFSYVIVHSTRANNPSCYNP